MTTSFLSLFPALALAVASPAAIADAAQRSDALHECAVAHFTTSVNRHAELHRRVENPLSELMTADPEQAARARSLLRTAIRDARATARPGDLFTSAIAADLRARIETAVQAIYRANAASFGELDDSALRTVPLAVNDTLPWGAADVRWGAVLEALPDLPKELAYRLVGRDLVLLDVETNLVVDVLERAFFLDRPGATDPVEAPDTCAPESLPLIEGSPCHAHPELEMCWS